MNNGWLKYKTGTTNLRFSSSLDPTLIAKQPFGTSLTPCLMLFLKRFEWKLLRFFPREPIISKRRREKKTEEKNV